MKPFFLTLGVVLLTASLAACGNPTVSASSATDTANVEISSVDSAEESSEASKSDEATATDITFSSPAGLYESSFTLELSTNLDGVIRYTTDGSEPTSDSQEYSQGILIENRTDEPNDLSAVVVSGGAGAGGPGGPRGGTASASAPEENVFKGNVIRAAVFSQSGEELSSTYTASYFVSDDIYSKYGDLPIISLVTNRGNLFSEETGIYVNYEETGEDWERPVYMEMFDTDGRAVVSQELGIRINGGTTRSLAQKAFRLYAKDSYDPTKPVLEYEFFPDLTNQYDDQPIDSFKRVILRSSGNDNSSTLFRDVLMQDLVSDLNVNTQAGRPAVAFIDGEFWGIYNIRERYDKYYFAEHYGVDKDKVTLLEISQGSATPEIKDGEDTALDYYNEMMTFFADNSMTDEQNYAKALEYVDEDNLIDYYIANIYSANSDWPANNNIFWRYQTENGGYDSSAVWYEDGRYRWLIKDMDWGFGLRSNVSDNTLLHALNENSSSGGGRGGGMGFTSEQTTRIFRKLLENPTFQMKFINRFCDVMNVNYNSDTVIAAIDMLQEEIALAIPEQANRFPSSISSVFQWDADVEVLREFALNRTPYVQGFLKDRFNLSDVVNVSITTTGGDGNLSMNGLDVGQGFAISTWNGGYFSGTTHVINAVAPEGKTVSKILITDNETGTKQEYTASSAEFSVGKTGNTIEVVFE